MTYGKIVVCNDEWPFSNAGFANAPDTTTYLHNILGWFTSKSAGKFLQNSAGIGYQTTFQQSVESAGHQLVIDASENMDAQHLLATYDGVFLAGNAANNQDLIDYVNGGGCVYVAAGTRGDGQDAELWNTFLGQFGLSIENANNHISGNQDINSSHPILQGVSKLYMEGGNWIQKEGVAPDSQLIGHSATEGMFAVTDLSGVVIQPAWEDEVIRIDWAVDPNGDFDCNPKTPNLNQDVLGSFPGWFYVTNKVNLPLTGVSIQINVNENARTWDTLLKNHDEGDENDRTVTIGSIPANGTQQSPTLFKWQVKHAGVRFQWDSFNVNFSLIPEYTVSYTPGMGPAAQVQAIPHETQS